MAAKRYLAIETSSPRLSLAVGDEKRQVAFYQGPHEWRHAESLFEGTQKLLRRARWPVNSLTGIAVCVGPGSFTGIRIGLAFARALGQSLHIPVVGVNALELLAAGARTKSLWRAPQIDALRGQLFVALYKQDAAGLKRVLPESMVDAVRWPTTWRQKTRREAVWVSKMKSDFPDSRTLLGLARPRFSKAGPSSYKQVLPLYIRRAAAEERRP